MSEELPESDRIDGAPHPRETQRLFGQDAAVARFLEAYNSGRLHSGWLLTGPRGIGKATLAWKIATFLLSEDAASGLFGGLAEATSLDVSSEHPDARLVQSGAHPRLYVVRRPVDEKTHKLKSEITVDAVRGLKGFFQMSAADGGRRVVIVDCADELNRNAANAILKELEEPPTNTTLLLLSHQPSRLLPTIRSRCTELRCAPLSATDLTAALEQANMQIEAPDALTALCSGSAGDAIRLLNYDGLPLYAKLVSLFDGLPNINRPIALKLADSCAGRGSETRFAITLDLMDVFISRAARAGLVGEPNQQGAPGEARLLARLAPHDVAARHWAELQQQLVNRSRHGKAVNLDPASMILDMIFKIEKIAQKTTAP